MAGIAGFAGTATTLLKVESASRTTLAVKAISHWVRHKGDIVQVLTWYLKTHVSKG